MSSQNDPTANLKKVAEAIQEINEHIASPIIDFGTSVSTLPLVTAICWPLDVLKNHILGGKDTKVAFKNVYSSKGLGVGLVGAGVLSLDITSRYVEKFGQDFSFQKKLLIGAFPLLLLPFASVTECLKINSQISQTTSYQSFKSIVSSSGYRGIFRGILPYSSIFLLTYCCFTIPIYYNRKPSEKKAGLKLGEPEPVYVNPLFIIAGLTLSVPLDIIKTKTMLGEKLTKDSFKMCPKHLAKSFAIRTSYMLLVCGAFSAVSIFFEQRIFMYRADRYQEKKKAKFHVEEDMFDGFIPTDCDDLKEEEILMKSFVRDG